MSFEQQIQLITLPFAGGNKYSYLTLKKHLSNQIKVVPVELPGRGSRMKEPLLTQLEDMVDDVFNQVSANVSNPYILYGHSMGALIGHLLIQRICALGLNLPLHFIASGHPGPQAGYHEQKARHKMSNDAFQAELREMGGCPQEVLDNDDLMAFFLPVLRADFQAIETYRYQPKNAYGVPITSLIGSDEDISAEDQNLWKRETTQELTTIVYPGNHFFIFDRFPDLAKLIQAQVKVEA